MLTYKGIYTTGKVMIDQIDEASEKQIKNMVNHPAFTGETVFMPDCHAGAGAVIGTTAKFNGLRIVPNTIGVDIGCGILAQELPSGTKLPNLKKLDKKIRKAIPMGTNIRSIPYYNIEKDFPWLETTWKQLGALINYKNHFNDRLTPTSYSYDWFISMCDSIGIKISVAMNSLGTLGGGNHFIEIGKAEHCKNYFILIHSGSRQFGLRICNFWQKIPTEYKKNRAQKLINEAVSKIRTKYLKTDPKRISEEIEKMRNSMAPVPEAIGLEFIEDEDMHGYLIDMIFAQAYAQENRRIMMEAILNTLKIKRPDPLLFRTIETVHNYINFDDFIIRKGAVSAYNGEQLVIPLNNEDGALLCVGNGNEEWNYSAPHGAGRAMSRKKAKEQLDHSDAERRMKKKGIFASSVPTDEMKEAYKDAKLTEKAIEPTVSIVDKIRPIINIRKA